VLEVPAVVSLVPEDIREIFTTAHDVKPEQHIRMQAAFQQFNDSGISKTCNFPHDATEDDVREIYQLAEAMQAALGQIEKLEQANEDAKQKIAALEGGLMRKPEVRSRPAELRGVTRKIDSPLGDM
jgi:ribonucleoside-diphosphate reductase alpha chain